MYMYICVYIILSNGPHFKSGKLNNWTLDSTCIKKSDKRHVTEYSLLNWVLYDNVFCWIMHKFQEESQKLV